MKNTPQQFQRLILTWFDQHGRKNLPWQEPRTAYRVWVSEVMLQQTQVNTVIPYFQRFIQRFPTVLSLAEASEDEVLQHWAGLGFYARARNLHAAAKILQTSYAGKFPQDLAALQTLPGVGRSTAGAIYSLAMGKPAPILDGNVKRVFTRLYAIEGSPSSSSVTKQLWEIACHLVSEQRPADYTQALMDLGALVCTPTQPNCEVCPVKQKCRAHSQGTQLHYPTPKPTRVLPIKQTQLLLLQNSQQEILLEKRPPTGIWGGLWSLPECPPDTELKQWCKRHYHCNISKWKPLADFRHTFSHFHLDITPVQIPVTKWQPPLMESSDRVWYNIATPGMKGLPAPVKKLLQQLRYL